jgi:hypothetical protein
MLTKTFVENGGNASWILDLRTRLGCVGFPFWLSYIRPQTAWNTVDAGQVIYRLCLDTLEKRNIPAPTGNLTSAVQMVSCM